MSSAMSWAGRELGVVVIGDGQIALAADGPLGDALMFRRTQTGDALETAVAAARMGVEVAFVTRVGADVFGDWLLESWEDEHLHLDYARQVPGRNALTLVGADADGRQSLPYREGVAATMLDEEDVTPVPWELARVAFAPGSAQALGPRPRSAVLRAFQLARDHGVTTVYDPTLRPGTWPDGSAAAARAAFAEVMPLTDVLVIDSPYATGKLLGHPDPEDAIREAAFKWDVSRVVVRRGRRELVVAEGGEIAHVALADPPEIVRSGGATSAFDGALLARLSDGVALAAAARIAGRAQALALGRRAGLDSLPYADQLPEQDGVT